MQLNSSKQRDTCWDNRYYCTLIITCRFKLLNSNRKLRTLFSFFFTIFYFLFIFIFLFFLFCFNSVGAPLSESDLKPMEELAQDIKDWNVEYQSQLRLQSQSQIPLGVTDENNRQAQAQHTSFDTKSTGRRLDSAAEDLYDF